MLDDSALSQTAKTWLPAREWADISLCGRQGLDQSTIQGLAEHLALEADWQDRAFETSEFDAALAAFAKR